MTHSPSRASDRAALAVIIVAFGALLAMVLVLSGRPLATADTWYYLKMGELYSAEGPGSHHEPMLFTHGDVEPTPHEWLSEVLFYQVQHHTGFQGLRAFHVLLVVLSVGLAVWAARRRGVSWPLSLAVGVFFLVLSQQRLYQTRADLFSIPCALAILTLVLDRPWAIRRPTIAISLVILVFWANAHSLFLIAFALAGATGLGLAFEAFLARSGSSVTPTTSTRSLRALGLFVLAGLVATAVNPRGFAQHVTFFTSSGKHAIWDVTDDWFPFSPLSLADNSPMLSPLAFLAGNITLLLLVVAAVLAARQAEARRDHDPAGATALLDLPGLMVGIASCAAFMISFRFLWMGIFAVLYAARVFSRLDLRGTAPVAAALATLGLVLTPGPGQWTLLMGDVPKDPATYLATPVNHAAFAGEGARFLSEAGVRGRLFNNYTLGAYLGYHLAPGLRTFIDGRTEHYPALVAQHYDVIERGGYTDDGVPFTGLLEAYGVDLFFGVGGPGYGYVAVPTLRHLESITGWLLVYRSAGFAIYARRPEPRGNADPEAVARRQTNLDQIQRHYRGLGVPFDPAVGFDVGAVIRAAPQWAVSQRLVPPGVAERVASPGGVLRDDGLVTPLFVAGDYAGAARSALGTSDPNVAAVGVEAFIALGRYEEASEFLQISRALGMDDAKVSELMGLLEATRGYRATQSSVLLGAPDPPRT
ncbi:MAG: hypothetical protein IV100_05645 [Myxococcales bacterium]|nr:hypothetical protein [Myxococcales bacterium]